MDGNWIDTHDGGCVDAKKVTGFKITKVSTKYVVTIVADNGIYFQGGEFSKLADAKTYIYAQKQRIKPGSSE